MSESDQEQSSPEPLSPRTAAVRAGLRRNYSSSSTESKSYESESSSKMAEIPNNNNNVGGGLLDSERMMVDATSGEGLMNKTADEAFTLFESLSANSQQWSHNKGRGAPMKAVVSEVSTNNEIAAKLDVMCSLLQQAVTGPLGSKVEVQDQSFAEHMLEQANALQARNPNNDPYSNTYNPGWRNHPNFKWSNNSNVQQSQGPPPGFQIQQRQFQQAPQQVQEQKGDQMGELQDMFKKFMGQQMQTNQNLQNAVNKLEVQVGQIASSMSNRASGTFPSQTEVNPRHQEHAKAVHILRSGKQVDNKVGDANEEQEDGENVEILQPPHGQPTGSTKQPLNAPGKSTGPKVSSNANQVPISTNAFRPIAPFPSRLSKSKKDQGFDEIMETFKKVQINIPLLNAIAQIPKYAKFLKDLCTNKRRFKEHEQVALSEEVSAVLQRKLPPKLKDPGSFSIPCTVGDFKFQKALLDLGASINLMPYHVYEKLNLGVLQATSVSIQLADRTIRYPKGILEDVLVKVEELILPADFLVLEMEEAPIHDNQLPLILGRPFMATAGAIIDVKKGTLTMNVFDETIAFKVFEASKFPSDEHEVFQLDAIDTMVKEALPMSYLEPIEACITQSIRKEEVDNLEAVISPLLLELVCSIDSYIEVGKRYANQFESLPPPTNKVLPSIVQAPELELKQLPKHLKYAYLGESETLPVIIASQLGPSDEKKLLRVLKEHKTAIGWSIADIKGISPTMCMHKILLEDNAMPKRDAQRRLNPNMKEVVRKEVMKLLDVGIIYPISDSKWVSPVQVVPKKSGITVVKNEANELVPTRMTTGWRVDKAKIDLIASMPSPTSVKEVRSFLGHAGFYRRFIKDFSKIARPLCNLLAKDMDFVFDQNYENAFNALKKMLTTAPIIIPPDWSLPFELMCDASDYAVGAVLGQRVDKKPHAIYYASRTLNDAQLNYSTTEKELLAVIFALEKFRSYLITNKVIVYTDHAALKYLLAKKDAKPRLIRWILLLQEFDLEIKDKKGSENVVADHLSRLVHVSNEEEDSLPLRESFPDEQLFSICALNSLNPLPWFADIVNYLCTNELPTGLSTFQRDKLRKQARYYFWDDPYLFKHCPDQVIRRCVPEGDFKSILEFCHSHACGGHFGAKKTANKVLQSGFFWPTLFKDAYAFCASCDRCQRMGNLHARNQMPLTNILIIDIFDV
ncbi:unnamed protein product, partial [Prunus brigantina]